jgi:toxin ParE1/3/4
MRTVRMTAPADADITDILIWSAEHFGPSVQVRYARLIDRAIRDLADDAERLGSRARPELGAGYRTYHLALSRERARDAGGIIRRPRHFLLYRVVDDTYLDIIRVLHDAMDLDRYVPDDLPSDGEDE